MALEFLSPLHKASRQIALYLDGRTRHLGVRNLEGHLMTYLASYAPAPMTDLVRIFGLKRSTLTSLLDRLEEAGFVRREVNPGDRRSFLIEITSEGREVAVGINEHLRVLEDGLRSRLTAEERAGFRAVMKAVEEITQVGLKDG